MASRVGAGEAVHRSAVGRARLASLAPKATEHAMLALSACADPTALRHLREQVMRARADGFAMDDEENEMGICCFGVALPGGQSCVSVRALHFRLAADTRAAYI